MTAGSHTHDTAARGPKGAANVVEAAILFIRDEVALKNIGHGGERYVPYVVSVFFFILFCNLLGLLPWGASPTGNVSVTAALAIMTFLVVEIVPDSDRGARALAGAAANPAVIRKLFLAERPRHQVDGLGGAAREDDLAHVLGAEEGTHALAAVLVLGLAYRFFTPVSTLMLGRWATFQGAARTAEAEGLPVETRVADAEALPFADASFDVVLSTIGVMFFLIAVVQEVWGTGFLRMDSPFAGRMTVVGAQISSQRVIIIVTAMVVLIALTWFLKKSVHGQAIEAVEQDRTGATLVGINPGVVSMVTFAVSFALVAVSAGLVAPIQLS